MPRLILLPLLLLCALLASLGMALPARAQTAFQCSVQWRQTNAGNERSLERFIAACPRAVQAAEARRRLAALRAPPTPAAPSCETRWEALSSSRNVAALRTFARQCNGTRFAGQAQARIAAITAPPPVPVAPPIRTVARRTPNQLALDGQAAQARREYAQAFSLFEQACAGNDGLGCNEFGVAFSSQEFNRIDYRRAVGLYERACELGFPRGCENARLLYSDKGYGILDLGKAVIYYDKLKSLDPDWKDLCTTGSFAQACLDTASQYFGQSSQNWQYSRVIWLYKGACDNGLPDGCYSAGALLENGKYGMENRVNALKFFDVGCNANHAQSCYELGRLQVDSRAGVVNPAASRISYQKACNLKVEEACAALR